MFTADNVPEVEIHGELVPEIVILSMTQYSLPALFFITTFTLRFELAGKSVTETTDGPFVAVTC